MSEIEALAVLFNLLGVWLTIRRVMLCWPVGIVAVALYAWLFWGWRLYADMGLQLFYLISQSYGWIVWRRARGSSALRPIGQATGRSYGFGILVAGVASAGLGVGMASWTDDALPYLDAALTAFSLLATFWAARGLIVSWLLWVLVDLAYAMTFVVRRDWLSACLYAVFVGLAGYGAYRWWQERIQ